MGFRCWLVTFALGVVSSVSGQTTAPATTSMLHLPDGVDRVVIPLETAGTLLFAKINVDGHEGRFAVDTGTSFTSIDRETAEQWKLNPAGSAPSADSAVPVQLFRVHRLSCATAEFAPKVVDAVDLGQFKSILSVPLAGLLGSDLLGEVPFEIDYRKQTLTIYDPAKFAPPAEIKPIPLRFVNGTPAVEGSIDGFSVEMLIDTGGAGQCSLSAVPFFDHPQLLDGKPTWDTPVLGLKGMRNDFHCQFDRVSLLGRPPRSMWFTCSREYKASDNIQTSDNSVDSGELQDGCFAFDYRHQRMWATWRPKETAEQTLSRLGDLNARDLSRNTPLMRAAASGRPDLVSLLLDRGADVNAKTSLDETSLMFAAMHADSAATKILLAHGARTDVSATFGGDTALHFACQGVDIDVVRELLQAGADPNALDTHGWTPLKRAAEGNQLDVAAALMAAGADPLIEDKEGLTPLLVAARQASPQLLGAMLEKLGKGNAAQSGAALVMAAWYGRLGTVKSLLDRGADPNYVNVSGATALIASAQDPSGTVAALLLSRGANPAFRSKEGKTAWDYACAANQLAVLRALGGPPAMPADQR